MPIKRAKMGIAKSSFRIFKATRREDPMFGSMRYMGGRSLYWEGKATFPDAAENIEVFVEGSAER